MRQEGYYKARYKDSNTVIYYDKVADTFIWFNKALKIFDFQWIDEKPILFDEPKEFQVKIIGCKSPQGWYRNLVGTILNVTDRGDFYIPVDGAFDHNDSIYRLIHKEDAEKLAF